ncbi:MAG TPA: hypothetical protein VHQ90_02050 [Thermoanaerobaculia bacterium]|nr:hypothetical protein [Thermoanaerobaculia bacterium]
MVNEEVLRHVDPAWRGEFKRFIETGEASEGFLRYLDTDEECQQALDEVFASESASVAALAEFLQAALEEPGGSFPPVRRKRPLLFGPPVQRFALAASLLFALIAGFAALNLAVVERAHARRLATLERQNLEAQLAKNALERQDLKAQPAKNAAVLAAFDTTSTIAMELVRPALTTEQARAISINLFTRGCPGIGGTWDQNQKACVKGGEVLPFRPQGVNSQKLVAAALAPSRRQKRQETLHISYLLRSERPAPRRPQGATPPD